MNRFDRFLQGTIRDLTLGPPARRPRRRPETIEPAERTSVPSGRLVAAYALAIALPVLATAALIPFREDHSQTTAIILVVPVVAVAVLGATGPAVVAAVVAGLAYDVFLTRPYYRFVIDDADDIIAAATLVAVALVVGVLNSRLIRRTARDAARRAELYELIRFTKSMATSPTAEELTESACRHLTALLDLRECRWHAGYHGGSGPVLSAEGAVSGFAGDLHADRARLPAGLEVPAVAGSVELGRFVVTPRRGNVSSLEERLTAATIASLYATAATLPPAAGGPTPV